MLAADKTWLKTGRKVDSDKSSFSLLAKQLLSLFQCQGIDFSLRLVLILSAGLWRPNVRFVRTLCHISVLLNHYHDSLDDPGHLLTALHEVVIAHGGALGHGHFPLARSSSRHL